MADNHVGQTVVVREILGFAAVIVVLWIDELFDLPHLLFGTAATPINWAECALESLLTGILAFLVAGWTLRALEKARRTS